MSTAYVIPLQATPQTLSVTLGGTTYNFQVVWNDQNQSWVLDIYDRNNNPLAQGIPLVTGVNLLEQLEYLGIPGQLVAQTDNNPDAVPTFTNLGSTSQLYYIPSS